MDARDVYSRVYAIRESLSDYLEGPRSLNEAERRIGEALPMLDGLLQTLHAERKA